MKAVIVYFDSLNRCELPAYGGRFASAPNFERLARESLVFERFYAGSLPCMPARRELHTGRYNFLHCGWSPLQPYDESLFRNLSEAGVYTHLVTDHFHYWEDGGNGYMQRFDSFEMIRGQQGDTWIGQVAPPEIPESLSLRVGGDNWKHDWINRSFMKRQEEQAQHRTFAAGFDFIERNHEQDNWLLVVESFDPHEPFFVPEQWRQLYGDDYAGPNMDWPDYGPNRYSPEVTEHLQKLYRALLSQCDAYLGRLLDYFDRYDLWKDTLLIVSTDHGFMLGEKGWMGKNVTPMYEEVSHIPFFLYDPRFPESKGQRRCALAQTSDLAPTLAEFFGISALRHADGHCLRPVIARDEAVRDYALFGVYGQHVCVTDGRYVLLKAPQSEANQPLFEYSLTPVSMRAPLPPDDLVALEAVAPFNFMDGAQGWRLPRPDKLAGQGCADWLFDLEQDAEQLCPIEDAEIKARLLQGMKALMQRNEAPEEQYLRLGLS